MKPTKNMIVIDGAHGEGGGQVLRSALAASLITGRSFRLDHVRGRRRKPGLLRQHLTGLRAAAEVGDARITGDEMGSQRVDFFPRGIRGGDYTFHVGTAGSAVLVLQTVLPALLRADRPSTVTVSGGTHARWAPSFDFFARAFLPCLESMGMKTSAILGAYGFYPVGGGQITMEVTPLVSPQRLELLVRGTDCGRHGEALVARLSSKIATRQLRAIEGRLGWSRSDLEIVETDRSKSPGNVVTLTVRAEHVTEMFTAYGQVGVSAEKVAREAVDQARSYLASDAPVGEFLADQLLLPMIIAGGGAFRTIKASRHLLTNLEVLSQFFDFEATIERDGSATHVELVVPNLHGAAATTDIDRRPSVEDTNTESPGQS